MSGYQTVIAGTGSYLPEEVVPNAKFRNRRFLDEAGEPFAKPTEEIIDKFEAITGIAERRYVTPDLVTSDIAHLAADDALVSSGTEPETLDYLIVAHNFGDVRDENRRTDLVPSLAARVKAKLGIENPKTICYDVPFGCPGWLQAVIQADYYLRSGDAKTAIVIGAETLSRVCDPHDRDSMIYADGAGATVLRAVESDTPVGILAHEARSDTLEYAHLLSMGGSYDPGYPDGALFLKMQGHKLYEYALRTVPGVVKDCLEKADVALRDVKKIFLHQANDKMDAAIVKRLCKLCGLDNLPADTVPMTIGWLGNSSVATIPTLLDLVLKGRMKGHSLVSGDLALFASVGAGMNVNAFAYRVP